MLEKVVKIEQLISTDTYIVDNMIIGSKFEVSHLNDLNDARRFTNLLDKTMKKNQFIRNETERNKIQNENSNS